MSGVALRVPFSAALFLIGGWLVAFDAGEAVWIVEGLDRFPDLGVFLVVAGHLWMMAGPSEADPSLGARRQAVFLRDPPRGTMMIVVLAIGSVLLGDATRSFRERLGEEHPESMASLSSVGPWFLLFALIAAGWRATRMRRLVEGPGAAAVQDWFGVTTLRFEPGEETVELDPAQRVVVHAAGVTRVVGRLCDDVVGSRTARFLAARHRDLRPPLRAIVDLAATEWNLGWWLGHVGWFCGAVLVLKVAAGRRHAHEAALVLVLAVFCASVVLAARTAARRRAWIRAAGAVEDVVVLHPRGRHPREGAYLALSVGLFAVSVFVTLALPGSPFFGARSVAAAAVAVVGSGLGMHALERMQRATSSQLVVAAVVDGAVDVVAPARLRVRRVELSAVDFLPTPAGQGGEVLLEGVPMRLLGAPGSEQRFRQAIDRHGGAGGYR